MAKVVALDAGHGLRTAGKQTPTGIKEWELNDKVRDKVVEMLNDYDVIFIYPDGNEGNKDESLTSRRVMYVKQDVDACVSIHHNAYLGTWGSATGVEVYVDKKSTAADKELANLIYKRMVEYTGLKGRGVKAANWTVINQNSVPAVLTEGGFMDNKKDCAIITSDKGQTAYAKAIAEALIDFLDLKKKNVTSESKPVTNSDGSFKVKFLETMNVRKGPGTKYKKTTIVKENYVYTIVGISDVNGTPWGKLKSGAGWVCIANKYCKKV